jgi:hypothetical protein
MFAVDSKGLAKIAERRGKHFVLLEMLQNAWDTEATRIDVTLEPVVGRPLCRLVVEDDDPDGFHNLSHAWTLFAESEKKSNPQKRGRFNLGEKLMLSLAVEAEIITTTGGVRFDNEGRTILRRKREQGSRIEALIKMTREEYLSTLEMAERILPPIGKTTTLNGEVITSREPTRVAHNVFLVTEISDEDGVLRRKHLDTNVEFHEVGPGEKASLYEMGIPVCETGDKWHANIMQKVPLNLERDGVSAHYLQCMRTAMLNTMHEELESTKEASEPWVRDAFASDDVSRDAASVVMGLRFGPKRVITDLSDREGEDIAKSRGYTVISGGSMSSDEWDTVKRHELALPAGQVTPSPRPFHPDGAPLKLLMRSEWTPDLRATVSLAERLAVEVIGSPIRVEVANDRGWNFNGTYGNRLLRINYGAMPLRGAIREGSLGPILKFLVHEFAHEYERNHLAEGFHEACCRIASQIAVLALKRPELFNLDKAPT